MTHYPSLRVFQSVSPQVRDGARPGDILLNGLTLEQPIGFVPAFHENLFVEWSADRTFVCVVPKDDSVTREVGSLGRFELSNGGSISEVNRLCGVVDLDGRPEMVVVTFSGARTQHLGDLLHFIKFYHAFDARFLVEVDESTPRYWFSEMIWELSTEEKVFPNGLHQHFPVLKRPKLVSSSDPRLQLAVCCEALWRWSWTSTAGRRGDRRPR
jgi:hypothetical protein